MFGKTIRLESWWPTVVVYLVFSSILALWRLGATDVVTMEGIVADGARSMIASGEYVVPRQHGEIYTFKPPGLYWLTAAATRIFGESEWALRLPSALSAVVLGLAVLWIVGARVGPRAGLVCGVASISASLTLEKLRVAEFDMALAAGVGTAAILAVFELTSENPKAWRWLAVYTALAGACLVKGIPALMYFAPGLLVAAWMTSSWRRLFAPSHLIGIATFVVLFGAWVLAAWRLEGAGAFLQPLSEANEKGLSWTLDAAALTLLKPLVFLASFLPWSVVLFWTRVEPADGKRSGMIRGALGFVLGGLTAFMLVPSTESRYLLPLAGPVGVLAGLTLSRATAAGLATTSRRLAGLVAVVLSVGPVVAVASGELEVPWRNAAILTVFGLLFIGLVVYSRRLAPRPSATLLMAGTAVGLWLVYVYGTGPHRASSRSLRSVAQAFEPHLKGVDILWSGPVSPAFHHSSLIYYLRRPVRTYSDSEDPAPRIPPPDAFVVAYSDEGSGPGRPLPFRACLVETGAQRHYEFALLRVLEVTRAHRADAPRVFGELRRCDG